MLNRDFSARRLSLRVSKKPEQKAIERDTMSNERRKKAPSVAAHYLIDPPGSG